MTEAEAKTVIAEELASIAPDIDFADFDPADDLRDAFEIDSMDFLNLVTTLSRRLAITIPETDYPELSSVDLAAAYVAAETDAARGP